MAIKWTILGLAIYATMGLYLVAAVLFLARVRRIGYAVYGVGCAVAVAAWVYRWGQSGHVPLQNLFEVFLTLGMLMLPVTLFCRRFLEVGGEAADAVIGIVILFAAGFVFNAEPKMLVPALQSSLFVPHVAAYMLAYAIMAKAAVQALRSFSARELAAAFLCLVPRALAVMLVAMAMGPAPTLHAAWRVAAGLLFMPMTLASSVILPEGGLATVATVLCGVCDVFLLVLIVYLAFTIRPRPMATRLDAERSAYAITGFGFPLLTLGLVLGAVWGKIAWGDYWNWDPKELWSLASWLVFLAYLHVRYMYGKRFPRLNCALAVLGLVAIVLTLLWVNLARIFGGGLHSYA